MPVSFQLHVWCVLVKMRIPSAKNALASGSQIIVFVKLTGEF